MPPRWLSLCWLCALRRPRAAPLGGRGFLFASDEADLLLTAAARLKAVVPGARVAAVCDATGAAVIAAAETAARETLFDAVIVTAAVSRPEALNATPFDATVAFDADGLACDGFGAALDGDVRAKRYPARDVYKWSDTFLAFARTAETARLFEAWRAAGDLRRSLAERAVYGSLRTALLRPAPNCAAPTYQCGDNAWNPRGARACAVVHGRAFNDKDREAAESLDRRPPGGAAAVHVVAPGGADAALGAALDARGAYDGGPRHVRVDQPGSDATRQLNRTRHLWQLQVLLVTHPAQRPEIRAGDAACAVRLLCGGGKCGGAATAAAAFRAALAGDFSSPLRRYGDLFAALDAALGPVLRGVAAPPDAPDPAGDAAGDAELWHLAAAELRRRTAGDSLKLELYRLGAVLASREACWSTHMANRSANDVAVVFLRSPRLHVRSTFVHCRNHRRRNAHKGSPTTWEGLSNDERGFARWLAHFVGAAWRPAFAKARAKLTPELLRERVDGCLHPVDLQARTLACRDDERTGESHFEGSERTDLAAARGNLGDADVVGLAEFYHESVCLVLYAYAGELPEFCACGSTAPYRHAEVRHNSAHAGVNVSGTFAPAAAAALDALTALDAALYVAALARFLADVREVEAAAGARILCPASVARARPLVAYIPGAARQLDAAFEAPDAPKCGGLFC
ncbi:hypothetical protein JL721_4106 [Aureococcus anophagefferens]|nr:hypothetical protein JL721_4106 [Aureococcus anophagefferens]